MRGFCFSEVGMDSGSDHASLECSMAPASGYIGLTDPDWYRFLSHQRDVQEVNFWQPHGNRTFKALRPGDPFFFKLRAPFRSIAGFGIFSNVLGCFLCGWRGSVSDN